MWSMLVYRISICCASFLLRNSGSFGTALLASLRSGSWLADFLCLYSQLVTEPACETCLLRCNSLLNLRPYNTYFDYRPICQHDQSHALKEWHRGCSAMCWQQEKTGWKQHHTCSSTYTHGVQPGATSLQPCKTGASLSTQGEAALRLLRTCCLNRKQA